MICIKESPYYIITEDQGIVAPTITLTNLSSTDITITVISNNETATGEITLENLLVRTCVYIHKTLLMHPFLIGKSDVSLGKTCSVSG